MIDSSRVRRWFGCLSRKQGQGHVATRQRCATPRVEALEDRLVPSGNPVAPFIESISYGGTGSPQGTVGQSISDDRKVATLIFDSFVASTGPGEPITESRKNSQINVNLAIPQGWSHFTMDITYRGYTQLAAGQISTQSSLYYFSGSTQQARASTTFRGPAAKDYTIGDRMDLEALVWATSNLVIPVNINSQVRIVGDASHQGQMTTDSINLKITPFYGIQWSAFGPLQASAATGGALTSGLASFSAAAFGNSVSSSADDTGFRADGSATFVDTIPLGAPVNVGNDLVADFRDYLKDQIKASALGDDILAVSAALASVNDTLAAERADLEQLQLDPEANADAINALEHQIDKDEQDARKYAQQLEKDQDKLAKVQLDLTNDLQDITDDLQTLFV